MEDGDSGRLGQSRLQRCSPALGDDDGESAQRDIEQDEGHDRYLEPLFSESEPGERQSEIADIHEDGRQREGTLLLGVEGHQAGGDKGGRCHDGGIEDHEQQDVAGQGEADVVLDQGREDQCRGKDVERTVGQGPEIDASFSLEDIACGHDEKNREYDVDEEHGAFRRLASPQKSTISPRQ